MTRAVSPAIVDCTLTHLPRRPIDVELALEQHREYERCLEDLGCRLHRLPAGPDLPDSVFIEDTAVVFEELAILARPGTPSRQPETQAVANALAGYRRLAVIEPPGTLDGGDVLRVDRTVYVGRSTRTDRAGASQLARLLAPLAYEVRAVDVRGCLHLKSAVTAVAEDTLVINPRWVRREVFAGLDFVEVDPAEPFGANALRIGERVVCSGAFPRTRRRLEERGIETCVVDLSELAKAEGGVTCCSLVFAAA